MLELQEQILQDPDVQEVLGWQQPDGWLAWDFHGSKSIETGIRILCEKGLSRQNPCLAQALQALEEHPERLERGIGKPGRTLDELGFGGSRMIRAAVGAYAGLEQRPFVKEQVAEALAGFRSVLDVESIQDGTQEYQGRLVFKPGLRWPGIYHLRLLAFTHDWRTAGNRAMLAAALQRLVEFSPLPDIYVRNKSGWIAPASFCMQDFNPDLGSVQDREWMMWFQRIECLARTGVIRANPDLSGQVEHLKKVLEAGGGWFTGKPTHAYFSKWGAYTGLRLEPDWRRSQHRRVDLTFRSMLILHYYES